MAGIVVLFLHRDPVVQAIVGGMLADEVELCFARDCAQAASLAAERQPAVLLADTEGQGEEVQGLVRDLRARDPHLRSVFFVEARAAGKAWQLGELGTVLPKDYDLDRLRLAVRREERLWRMSRGEGEAGSSRRGPAVAADATTTRRQVRPPVADATATQRLSYFARAATGEDERTPVSEEQPKARSERA